MHNQSKQIFYKYLKKTKELKLDKLDFQGRDNLLKQLVIETIYVIRCFGDEELLLQEVSELRNIYQQGRVDALQDLKDAQDILFPDKNI